MGLFAANWKIQVENIQAPVYRVGALLDYLRALGGGLQGSNDIFNTFDATVRKQSLWNGQKITLQAALNDYFSLPANTIRIVTNVYVPLLFIYNEAESNSTFIYNEAESTKKFVYNEGEITNGASFTIYIPSHIYTAEIVRRVSAIATLYKLAGTTFNIIEDFMIATVTISSAQILAGFTTPVEIIPAPGAGKIIVPIAFEIKYTFATAAYAVNTTFDLFIGTVSKLTVAAMINQAANRYIDAPLTGSGVSAVVPENTNMTFKVQTGNPTTGAGNLQINVIYGIVTVV